MLKVQKFHSLHIKSMKNLSILSIKLFDNADQQHFCQLTTPVRPACHEDMVFVLPSPISYDNINRCDPLNIASELTLTSQRTATITDRNLFILARKPTKNTRPSSQLIRCTRAPLLQPALLFWLI